ncbi:hypothetical protein WN51_07451 [Melipona quadrifasciata]|uniref:Uncharacterized protein n=1 Tax=Melipona quadrifasciata TaxID=166423 RepID=A0A0M9A742_9HYME|nr:hypothetical protein WN51_07451 [Melipona quadrifasciata]
MDAGFNTDVEFYSFVLRIIQVLHLPFLLKEMEEDIELLTARNLNSSSLLNHLLLTTSNNLPKYLREVNETTSPKIMSEKVEIANPKKKGTSLKVISDDIILPFEQQEHQVYRTRRKLIRD